MFSHNAGDGIHEAGPVVPNHSHHKGLLHEKVLAEENQTTSARGFGKERAILAEVVKPGRVSESLRPLQVRSARPGFVLLINISRRQTTRGLLFFEHFLATVFFQTLSSAK
jgi:hypothetical protein